MAKQAKMKCLGCEESFYIKEEDAEDVVPEGAGPGEAFHAHCPFCKRTAHVMLAQ